MKYLIVNGDDFGACRGINRGIVEAHVHGILTSTSLMVDGPASAEAAGLGRELPGLSVGLHVDLPPQAEHRAVGLPHELRRQFRRFQELTGCAPTHLDSHHDVHRDPRILPHFLELSREHGLPLRGSSPARWLPGFYGQWGGRTHLEQISVVNLLHLLETEVGEGVTELSCHPGHADPDLHSSYAAERQTDLRTLCDPALRTKLEELGITLIGFREISRDNACKARKD